MALGERKKQGEEQGPVVAKSYEMYSMREGGFDHGRTVVQMVTIRGPIQRECSERERPRLLEDFRAAFRPATADG